MLKQLRRGTTPPWGTGPDLPKSYFNCISAGDIIARTSGMRATYIRARPRSRDANFPR